jgi:hypothetical protein
MIQVEVIGINVGIGAHLPFISIQHNVSMVEKYGEWTICLHIHQKTGVVVLVQIAVSEHYETSPRIL